MSYANDIRSSGESLLETVKDILDMTALESGTKNISAEPVELGALMNRVVARFSEQVSGSGLTITASVPETLPHIEGDPHLLKRVFSKILSNAVKFSPENGVIRVSVKDEKKSVTIKIADNGIGMSEEDIEIATSPFGQANTEYLNRQHGGVGIGLALARGYVELHKGRMFISSRKNEGTTVEIWLPVSEKNIQKS